MFEHLAKSLKNKGGESPPNPKYRVKISVV